MIDQLLTTAQVLKDRWMIDKNLNNNEVDRAIMEAQNREIKPVLGYAFYEQLMIEVSGGTTTTANQYLLDNYLIKIIGYGTSNRIAITKSYIIDEAGVRTKNSDLTQLANDAGFEIRKKDNDSSIKIETMSMWEYLDDHKDDYPLIYQNNKINQKKDYYFSIDKI